jgi:phosphoglycolate phosphatase-like HAD superfamily hydrolase
VTAQDPEVQRFKPHPRGLEVTLGRLGVSKREAIYIGDRADVDGEAAGRAGVRCVIVRRSFSRDVNDGIASFLATTQS